MEIQGSLQNKISGKIPDFGAIFMSNASTREECFKRKLFGLPISFADFVKGVKVGMILFLFEYEKRDLYVVFKATTDGELNIIPYPYSSTGKKFPAQVRFTTIWHCHPLREHEFQKAIRDNYYATGRFNFGLSKDQIQRLLWLFDSRKIRLSQSQSFIDSESRKSYIESSSEKRETEKNWSNHTKIARKKPKRDVDSISHSNGELLAYSGKLTVAKYESQMLDSRDLNIACKESDSMHCNCSYCPEDPCSQSSLAVVAGHSSTSGQELGPHPDHAIQSQPVIIGEELKELETSGNLDFDLGDYIPLQHSDDSDCTDTGASPESGCFMKDHIGLLFSASGLFEDTCQPIDAVSPITKVGDVHIKENAYRIKSPVGNCQENEDSDYIHHNTSVRGLYSDASNNRSSVFSRLNFSSGVQDKEDDTKVEKSLHRTRKQKKCSTGMNKSAQEIMEELQQMHHKWKKTVRMTRSVERQNEQSVSKKTSVFLRLSSSVPDVQDNDISTRWQERRDKKRNMRETKFPVPAGKKTSVFLRLGKTSEPDVHSTGISTLLQERHDKQMKIGETECPVSSICFNGENDEVGKSLTVTDSDWVELDDNTSPCTTSPAVTRPPKTDKHHLLASNSLQEVYENLNEITKVNQNVMRLTLELMEMQDAENRLN